ncbi:hypothetical protein MKX03_030992 [Papaver bracteatum]|nr:hypothetical protein MKX03_030992 [Papaver bracteatum]
MQFGVNLRTGEKQMITPWRDDSDPSPGDFTLELDPYGFPQLIVKNGSERKWRSGPLVENLAQAMVEEFMGMDHPGSDFKLERDHSKGGKALQCEISSNNTANQNSKSVLVREADGFLAVDMWNVPDYYHLSQVDLIDTRETSKQMGFNLHIRVANSELGT